MQAGSGDSMPITTVDENGKLLTEKYSLWLSRDRISGSKDGTINDASFMWLGTTKGGFDFNIQYGGNVTGIFERPPSEAIYMDDMGGAKSDITLNMVRVNPNYSPIATSPPHPDDRFTLVARKAGYSAPNTGRNYNNITNHALLEELTDMRTQIQFKYNAHVLRMYRGMGRPFLTREPDGSSRPVNSTIPQNIYERGYIQYPVFLRNFNASYSLGKPNEMALTIKLFMRNPYVGFNNIKETWYG